MQKLILLFALSLTVLACNKNNDDDNPAPEVLSGTWNLVQITCFCTPINLEVGEYIWEIDVDASELHVQNNVTEKLHTIFETGTYAINITADTITVQSIEYDYYFEDNKLFLTNEPEADGVIIEFVRE